MHVNNLGGPRVPPSSVDRQPAPTRASFSALVQAGLGSSVAGRGVGGTLSGASVVASALASQQATPHSSVVKPYALALGTQAMPPPGDSTQVALLQQQAQAQENQQNMEALRLLSKLALLQFVQGSFANGVYQGPDLERY